MKSKITLQNKDDSKLINKGQIILGFKFKENCFIAKISQNMLSKDFLERS